MGKLFTVNSLKFDLLSTDDIETNSNGEVVNQHTLNADNKPAEKGLVCQEIFGVYLEDDRKLSSGHISLPFDIVNPLFYYNKDSVLNGLKYLLGMDLSEKFREKGIMKAAHYKLYYVTSVGEATQNVLKQGALLTRDEYFDNLKKLGDNAFTALSGFDLFKYAINNLNINECISRINDGEHEIALKSLVYIANNKETINKMFISAIPVLPAGMREVLIGNSELRLAHVHSLYRKIIVAKNLFTKSMANNTTEKEILDVKVDLIKSIEKLYLNETQLKPVYAPDARFMRNFNRLEYLTNDEDVRNKSNGEVDNHTDGDSTSLNSLEIFTEEGNGMGHIELATDVFHPLYVNETVAEILGVSKDNLERILDGEGYLVISSKDEDEIGKVYAKSTIYEKKAEALSDLDAIRALIANVKPAKIIEEIKKENQDTLTENQKSIVSICEKIIDGKINLNNLIIKVLPVLPSILRQVDNQEVNTYLAESINERYEDLIDINQDIISGKIEGREAFVSLQNAADRLMSREGFLNTIIYPNKIFVLTSLLGHIKYIIGYNSYWFNGGDWMLNVIETVLSNINNIGNLNQIVNAQLINSINQATEEEIIMFEKIIESLGFKIEIDSVESN